MNTLQDSEWLVRAVENWPISLAISILLLAFFLWFLAPFAVFGVKRRLDRLTELMEQVVTLLQEDPSRQPVPEEKDREGDDEQEARQP